MGEVGVEKYEVMWSMNSINTSILLVPIDAIYPYKDNAYDDEHVEARCMDDHNTANTNPAIMIYAEMVMVKYMSVCLVDGCIYGL